MKLLSRFKLSNISRLLTTLLLSLVLVAVTACGPASTAKQVTNFPVVANNKSYTQLELGNTTGGQNFGDWVLQTAKGLVKDAYVRDNNKLGVVITPQVRPNEVKNLASSLAQGFRRSFPNQDLTVLVYAPDKKLILTAKYDAQSKQIQYEAA